jgi:hypothetical protein
MGPVDAFTEAGTRHPEAARHWIEKINAITDTQMAILLDEVPPDRLSPVSRQFAIELMHSNRERIGAVGDML